RWRRARLHSLKFNSYEKYLETPHWQEFRKVALENQLKRFRRNFCERCPDEKKAEDGVELHVHHLTCERLGAEVIADVQIICRECHLKEHWPAPGSEDTELGV